MKICSVCNEIVSANRGCSLSNCPIQGPIPSVAVPGQAIPGFTGNSDRTAQAELARAEDVARDASRRAAFAIAVISLIVVAIVAIGFSVWSRTSSASQEIIKVSDEVSVIVIKKGEGPSPTTKDVVQVNYKGMLKNGKVFDQAERAVFPLDGVIPGFTKALAKMQKGGKYTVDIPAKLAYGPQEQRNPETGNVEIPANSDLVFEIELLDFKSRAEVEAQMRMMQQQLKR